ncbi:hypothetical protein Lalb_Chr14g0372141 [Lupinus albus]|uniref:Uncharacterized protein n=1 Tax=Lupinus albus TaxID=3870 RepID=A0A6A4PFV4_LUPAL|nr:hypothetical protein Lalb_Chr14g0372141 [Lupinus albus]
MECGMMKYGNDEKEVEEIYKHMEVVVMGMEVEGTCRYKETFQHMVEEVETCRHKEVVVTEMVEEEICKHMVAGVVTCRGRECDMMECGGRDEKESYKHMKVVVGTRRHKETFQRMVEICRHKAGLVMAMVEEEICKHMDGICKHVVGVICDGMLNIVHALMGYNGLVVMIHNKGYNQQQH